MRVVLIGLAVLVVLVVGAIVIGPSLIPSSVYRDQIASAVEKATGRPFKINGAVSLRMFPSVKASVNPPRSATCRAAKPRPWRNRPARCRPALFPLLSHQVQIQSFVLNDAVIHLEVDRMARPIGTSRAQPEPESAAAAPGHTAAARSRAVPAEPWRCAPRQRARHLPEPAIRRPLRAENINAKIELPSLDKPLKVDGDAIYNARN